MKYLCLLVFLLMLTSCATVLNENHQSVYFYTSKNVEHIKLKDSVYELPVRINVPRAKEELKVVVVTDSTDLNYTIQSELSDRFRYLNLTGVFFAPVNYAVDLTNNRRFEYPKMVYLDPMKADGVLQDSSIKIADFSRNRKYSSYEPDTQKGDIYFYLTISPFSYLNVELPEANRKNEGVGTGFGEVGFSYYYTNRNYLSVGAGANTTMIIFPLYENNVYAYTIKLANFHQFNRLNVGYGVFWGRNENKEYDYDKNEIVEDPTIESSHSTVGLVAAVHFEVARNFHVGFSYKPSLYRISSPKKSINNHLLSVELTYKLRLRNKKN